MEDKVLETVVNGLGYRFEKDVLVKPLDPIMITVEEEEQIPTGEVDEEGYNKYDVKKTTKEVESDFRKGVVLALPASYEGNIRVGDTVVYPKKFTKDFDLFKDSQLVKAYDIVAVAI
jgi:phage pi2 protein 07